MTTYHLLVPIVKKSGSVNLLEPCGSVQACNGTALSFTYGIGTLPSLESKFDHREFLFP